MHTHYNKTWNNSKLKWRSYVFTNG
jgi:hypothetical protein